MSYFENDQWYCNCSLPAKWYESKQPNGIGQLFARCPRSREAGCRFFIWEKDEPVERAARLADTRRIGVTPKTPQTGHRHTNFITSGLPTPGTGASSSATVGRTYSPSTVRETSPTPQHKRAEAGAERRQNGDQDSLFADVLALLRSENVVIKDSTRMKLRRVIDAKVGTYEAKMGLFQSTLSELSDKLATVEIRGV